MRPSGAPVSREDFGARYRPEGHRKARRRHHPQGSRWAPRPVPAAPRCGRRERLMKPTIMWKDGLPDDPLERAQIEQILKTAGLTSTYSSIKRLHDGDDE